MKHILLTPPGRISLLHCDHLPRRANLGATYDLIPERH
jgi:hypothetical protein